MRSIDREEMIREVNEIMEQLPPLRQRFLLEVARASKKAEHYLRDPPDLSPPGQAGKNE